MGFNMEGMLSGLGRGMTQVGTTYQQSIEAKKEREFRSQEARDAAERAEAAAERADKRKVSENIRQEGVAVGVAETQWGRQKEGMGLEHGYAMSRENARMANERALIGERGTAELSTFEKKLDLAEKDRVAKVDKFMQSPNYERLDDSSKQMVGLLVDAGGGAGEIIDLIKAQSAAKAKGSDIKLTEAHINAAKEYVSNIPEAEGMSEDAKFFLMRAKAIELADVTGTTASKELKDQAAIDKFAKNLADRKINAYEFSQLAPQTQTAVISSMSKLSNERAEESRKQGRYETTSPQPRPQSPTKTEDTYEYGKPGQGLFDWWHGAKSAIKGAPPRSGVLQGY